MHLAGTVGSGPLTRQQWLVYTSKESPTGALQCQWGKLHSFIHSHQSINSFGDLMPPLRLPCIGVPQAAMGLLQDLFSSIGAWLDLRFLRHTCRPFRAHQCAVTLLAENHRAWSFLKPTEQTHMTVSLALIFACRPVFPYSEVRTTELYGSYIQRVCKSPLGNNNPPHAWSLLLPHGGIGHQPALQSCQRDYLAKIQGALRVLKQASQKATYFKGARISPAAVASSWVRQFKTPQNCVLRMAEVFQGFSNRSPNKGEDLVEDLAWDLWNAKQLLSQRVPSINQSSLPFFMHTWF